MRVLVTGATGFVGRAVVTALAADGEEVYAAVRTGGSDGPLPLWADIALGGLLLGAARRAAPVRRRLSG